jgi:biopolymer transport protein ExbB/TolQ
MFIPTTYEDVTGMSDGWYFVAEMWQTASPQVEGSVALLVFMFFWVLITGTERVVRYNSAAWQSRSFLKLVPSLLERGNWDEVLALADERKRSHVAAVFAGGLREFCVSRRVVSVQWSIETAKRGARISANRLHEQLREGLSSFGTIAASAPLVGFFGTCFGILGSFRGIGMSRATALGMTALSMAEALVCSAMGVLVAVPTVWCFNWLRDRLSELDAEMDVSFLELVKYLEQQSRAGKL